MHENIEGYIRFILQNVLVVYQKLLITGVTRNASLKTIFIPLILITNFKPVKIQKLG